MQRIPANPTRSRTTYHHGNLTQALVEAAVQLIDEVGVESLSVREVAKRAGVSPGAPFRHFESKTALLTAVAEQAMERFALAVRSALSGMPSSDPIGMLRAMGRAYLDWATENPTHFRIISSRHLIDFAGSQRLVGTNAELKQIMTECFEEAQRRGLLREGIDLEPTLLACRAHVYGLARMWCDGHLEDWTGKASSRQTLIDALDLFIDGLLRP